MCCTSAIHTESYIGEIARFFQHSAKRQHLLDKAIDVACPESSVKRLKDTCRTRWVQHIDSYAVFLELLPAVHTTFQAMIFPDEHENLGTWDWDAETIMKATGFMHQLESSSFLICFHILLECLVRMRSVTVKLQMEASDVLYAYKEITNTITSFKNMRANATSTFRVLFVECTRCGKQLHGDEFELKKPRLASKQVHRDNVQISSVEDYYRITCYNEFLSHIVTELEDRFIANPTHSIGLLQLLPSQFSNAASDESVIPETLSEAATFYADDLPHVVMLSAEYRMWVSKWKQTGSNSPAKLIDLYKACDITSFPNIHSLLQLALTIPITSCECERSFSQLKLIKTAHRSTISVTRLSGLALTKINRERCEKINNSTTELKTLVQLFAQQHPRRIKLPFMLSD